jgi:ribosomal protein S27E
MNTQTNSKQHTYNWKVHCYGCAEIDIVTTKTLRAPTRCKLCGKAASKSREGGMLPVRVEMLAHVHDYASDGTCACGDEIGPLEGHDAKVARLALAETCSTCSRGPGWKCVTRSGKETSLHAARKLSAERRIDLAKFAEQFDDTSDAVVERVRAALQTHPAATDELVTEYIDAMADVDASAEAPDVYANPESIREDFEMYVASREPQLPADVEQDIATKHAEREIDPEFIIDQMASEIPGSSTTEEVWDSVRLAARIVYGIVDSEPGQALTDVLDASVAVLNAMKRCELPASGSLVGLLRELARGIRDTLTVCDNADVLLMTTSRAGADARARKLDHVASVTEQLVRALNERIS